MKKGRGLVALMVTSCAVLAACTETPNTASGSSGSTSAAPSTSGGGGSSSGTGGTSSGTTGGTTTGPQPLAVFGTIPGDSFSPMSALWAETPDAGGAHGTAVVISDLADACASLSPDVGVPSRSLQLTVGVLFPDGGVGPPTAPATFPVANELSSSEPSAGPIGLIVYENQVDGGCTAWLCTGGSIDLTSLDPVEGTFNVSLVLAAGEEPTETQLTGSFTATACPSLDFSLLICGE
jgi:predicted small secreted protein